MRFGRRGTAAVLLLVACADPSDRDAAAGPADAPGDPAAVEAAVGLEPMDSAAIAAAIAEEEAADSDAARVYRERVASMGTREECLRQAEGLSGGQRQRVEEACNRRRSEADSARRE